MISRKLIAALVGLSLAGGLVADASAATTSSTLASKPAAVQTTTKTTAKATPTKAAPKIAVGGKHVRKVAKLSAKHRNIRLSRHAVKRMKIAKTVNGKRVRLSHSLKRISSKKV